MERTRSGNVLSASALMMASLSHLAYSAVSLNAEHVMVPPSQTVFWLLEAERLVLVPGLFVILLACWERWHFNWIRKAVTAYWWWLAAAGLEEANQIAGLTQFNQWGMGDSLVAYAIILVLSVLFAEWYRRLARKDGLT